MVLPLPAVIEVSLGGLAGASAALVFAFLGPVFALLGLGPRRATAWFVAFVAVVLARGMLDAVDDVARRRNAQLQLRIGLASGPVVGGVIGHQRILFDIWGDTVNTASRMQSSGVAGRIQVARSTRDLLRDGYAFEEREPVEVKGLGPMTTYLLVESVRT